MTEFFFFLFVGELLL